MLQHFMWDCELGHFFLLEQCKECGYWNGRNL